MNNLLLIIAAVFALGACSSSAPTGSSESTAPLPSEKPVAASSSRKDNVAAKPFSPAKPMKCKFDTDCVVLDSCAANKCKLTGNECRFRSDCPSPRGTCIKDKCEFH